MKNILLALLLITLTTGCEKVNQSVQEDETKIKDFSKAYQEAFNKKDAERLAALWSEQGVYFNPVTGDEAEGREAIVQLYKKKFEEEAGKKLEIIVNKISFPESNTAIDEGILNLETPDQPTQQLAYKAEFVKENNQWRLQEIREIELLPAPSNYDHLKDLAWLAGKWVDEDDNVAITFNCQWDKYKNFLTQHFTMKIFDHDEFEGKQIIAWDAKENKIRSWVFDSDGGFGQGTWTKQDNSWYVPMTFTLSDGRAASSTNIYTQVDENSYNFASIEREVEDDILPNLDSVKVVKESP